MCFILRPLEQKSALIRIPNGGKKKNPPDEPKTQRDVFVFNALMRLDSSKAFITL